MTDDELITLVAKLWIANDGDAEGIRWCWQKIEKKVDELSMNQKLTEDKDSNAD